MAKNPKKNIAASVRTRLLTLSRESGEDFQRVLTRFALVRFISRLSKSRHSSEFIVKGAMLFTAWMPSEMAHRATRDLDLLGRGTPDRERLKSAFQEICQAPVEDDGLCFDPDTVKTSEIRPHEKYKGIRVTLLGHLQNAAISMQIDVGFGDGVSPCPVLTTFPSLLSFAGPTMMAYQRETSIAEKFQAMIILGVANSRMKDFLDITILARTFCFEADALWQAIVSTFGRRETPIPTELPLALQAGFSDKSKQTQWAGFLKKNELGDRWGDLQFVDAISEVRSFLWTLREKAEEGTPRGQWRPGDGWTFSR